MPYTKHVTLSSYGEVLGTALTTSYQTVIAATQDCACVFVFNNCNQPILVSFDGGTTDHYKLDEEGFDIDLRTNDLQMPKPTISVKKASTTPTSGSIRVTLLYV